MPSAPGRQMRRLLRLAASLATCAVACGGATGHLSTPPEYRPLAQVLAGAIEREMDAKALSAVSIALVDGADIVWAQGFGLADPEAGTRATPETVYRVGSVSKLLTDLAVMQLVERGRLDLDAPVTRYLSDFRPENAYGVEVTLRHLMAHRSGLVREPPVGNYFDSASPSLTRIVGSLNDTRLVYEPATRIKYSNAAIATVGYVLEATQGEPFASYLERVLLTPLGMTRSAFSPGPELPRDLAKGYMWTYDGREFVAPTFELGMAPAGSLYATVEDLGRFLIALLGGGMIEGRRMVEEQTLQEMWTPQFAGPGAREGVGLGFMVSELDGRRRLGHGGAIYGFATELALLPEERLGVVVVATRDAANAVTGKLADFALRLMLARRQGGPLPALPASDPVPPSLARRVDGHYAGAGGGIDLIEQSGRLFVTATRGGVRRELRLSGDSLLVDGLLDYGTGVRLLGDTALVIGPDTLRWRVRDRPAPAPERWRGLIGEYGWDHNTLFVLEQDGRLHALIEWFFQYPLEEVSRDTFAFPPFGLYHGERVIFTRGGDGRATDVAAAGVVFPRRDVGPGAGETFRIEPVRPVEELQRAALAATPPAEKGRFRAPDLVELRALDPSIRLDIRYASTDNFMSTPFYREARAFLQRPAAEALVRAHRALGPLGYGLLVHDAYRPWFVTKMFWEATPEDKRIFVANPANGSRHNRGAAVDLTLYDRPTGQPVVMVGGYDEMSPRSYPTYAGGTSLQRWHRDLLREAMEREGFSVYEYEWWHFDYRDWAAYPVMNRAFEELGQAPAPGARGGGGGS